LGVEKACRSPEHGHGKASDKQRESARFHGAKLGSVRL
jgi:hypothetical protein